MKTWTYSWIVYPIIFGLAYIYGLFNRKVRKTLELRSWKDFLSLRFNAGEPIEYWIHVASYGELEYAIPILRVLEKQQKKVLVTYYSISAKSAIDTIRTESKAVSLFVPLPHDGLGLMKEFVSLVKKQGIKNLLLMKYELWPGLLWECNRNQIKVFLVDALKPSWFHRKLIHKLDGILSGYADEVKDVGHPFVKVLGDTRVERVIERVTSRKDPFPAFFRELFKKENTAVFGSMWPKDDELMLKALSNHQIQNVIWVPHELDEGYARELAKKLQALGYFVVKYDDVSAASNFQNKPVAVITLKKGILSELYRLSIKAYVGGGFGEGVHSVWEPSINGAYVACGVAIDRSPEAKVLQSEGLLTVISNENELLDWLKSDPKLNPNEATQALKKVLDIHVGASERIVGVCNELNRNAALTNRTKVV